MKSVLISIQPKWCELIASGKKTVEIRKTKPKIYTPFKCYIYCTKSKKTYESFAVSGKPYECGGKVIGEFVCDDFTYIEAGYDTNGNKHLYNTAFVEHRMAIPDLELFEYLYKRREKCGGWAWHISNLVIYDKPKELSEFVVEGDCSCNGCNKCKWFDKGNGYNVEDDCRLPYEYDFKSVRPLKRPPQSWCYVETQ